MKISEGVNVEKKLTAEEIMKRLMQICSEANIRMTGTGVWYMQLPKLFMFEIAKGVKIGFEEPITVFYTDDPRSAVTKLWEFVFTNPKIAIMIAPVNSEIFARAVCWNEDADKWINVEISKAEHQIPCRMVQVSET